MAITISSGPVPAARPFLKWAGGKGQLIPAIEAALPAIVHESKQLVYAEPFIGSGAVLFWFLQRFPAVKKAVVNDINPDLANAYKIIKKEPRPLIDRLGAIQDSYYRLKTTEEKKEFFLERREQFNTRSLNSLDNTAL